MISSRSLSASSHAKDERRQILSSWVIWDGNIDRLTNLGATLDDTHV
jgi:hypothetical protein